MSSVKPWDPSGRRDSDPRRCLQCNDYIRDCVCEDEQDDRFGPMRPQAYDPSDPIDGELIAGVDYEESCCPMCGERDGDHSSCIETLMQDEWPRSFNDDI